MLSQEQNARLTAIQLTNANQQVRDLPFEVGNTFTFKIPDDGEQRAFVINHPATTQINAWDGVRSNEGREISTTQLLRRNNGLPLEGNTVGERFRSFCNWLAETATNTRTIRIARIIERHVMQADGKEGLQRTLVFEALA